MANPKPQLALFVIIGVPVLIASVVIAPLAFDLFFHRRPPERYLIPASFTGWARVDFHQKGAPPVPTEDGHRLFKLNAQGAAATSSEQASGHAKDDFFYYSADQYSGDHRTPLSSVGVCKGGMIWQVQTLVDSRTQLPYTRFFVGSEEQYRREVDPLGKVLPNCG